MDLSSPDIRARLPHAPPFVLIDRVENAGGGRGRAWKTFRPGEPWFAWHFPGDPLVPASILLEAMAQAAGLVHSADAPSGPPLRLLGEAARFRIRRAVRPGDTIAIDVTRSATLGAVVRFAVSVRAGDVPVAEAELTLTA